MLKRILQLFNQPAKRHEQTEHAWRVWDSGDAIHCTFRDANERIVRWESLRKIVIRTTDEGPFFPDVFWHFMDVDGEVAFPQGALGEKEISDRAMKLKGFDFEQFIKYVPCTDNAIFIVWKAPVAP